MVILAEKWTFLYIAQYWLNRYFWYFALSWRPLRCGETTQAFNDVFVEWRNEQCNVFQLKLLIMLLSKFKNISKTLFTKTLFSKTFVGGETELPENSIVFLLFQMFLKHCFYRFARPLRCTSYFFYCFSFLFCFLFKNVLCFFMLVFLYFAWS